MQIVGFLQHENECPDHASAEDIAGKDRNGAARQALTKLGVKWEPTEAERAYNEGGSTQVPVNPVVRIKGRFSRRLRDRNVELVLER